MGGKLVLAAMLAGGCLMALPLAAAAGPVQLPEGASRPSAEEENEGLAGSALRVPCDRVISRLNHEEGSEHGTAPDMSRVAKQLHTTVTWVERCMLAYGRRPRRPGLESAESREQHLEDLEEQEPEEVAPEDIAEPGARERKEHPEKERVTHVKPPPTPGGFFDYYRDWGE